MMGLLIYKNESQCKVYDTQVTGKACGPLVFYSFPNQHYDIIIDLLKCTGFLGERCGPWVSCFIIVPELKHKF